MNIEKNGNTPDVRDCCSLLSYQRRSEKKSVVSIYMNLKLREVSLKYIKLDIINIKIMLKATRIDKIIHEESVMWKSGGP